MLTGNTGQPGQMKIWEHSRILKIDECDFRNLHLSYSTIRLSWGLVNLVAQGPIPQELGEEKRLRRQPFGCIGVADTSLVHWDQTSR